MAVMIGNAKIDENGKITGGAAGDQTGNEVATQAYYVHKKGWIVIRAKDATVREKIAKCMEAACANNNIGYDQGNRLGLINESKKYGYDASKVTVKTETDCSATVRCCVMYAGINVADFDTSAEKSVLQKTGKFDILTDSKYCASSDYLLRGDILVTATKCHTAVVLSNGAKVGSTTTTTKATTTKTTTKPAIAKPTLKYKSQGAEVVKLQQDMNYCMPDTYTKPDGDFGAKTDQNFRAWQNRNGLNVDGSYGPKSYAKMQQLLK